MFIFFPTCTKLTVSQAWTFWHPDDKFKPRSKRRPHPNYPNRAVERDESVEFIKEMWRLSAHIPKVGMENPVGFLSEMFAKPTQIIHPWQFGHEESKQTCLWLKNLPLLVPTQIMENRDGNRTASGQNKISPSEDRWKIRSRTYEGSAAAMADQWTKPVNDLFNPF